MWWILIQIILEEVGVFKEWAQYWDDFRQLSKMNEVNHDFTLGFTPLGIRFM